MEKIIVDNTLDHNFKYEIAERPGGENIRKCFACGTCTAGCPAFHADHEYNPRKIIRKILLGLREDVLKSPVIWLCHQCYACSTNCPQDVDFSHIMMAIRDIAVHEGYYPKDRLEKVEDIGFAAAELRGNCVKMLMGDKEMTKMKVLEQVEQMLSTIEKEQ